MVRGIAFMYASGRVRRLGDLDHGLVPSEFFYGAHELAGQGYKIKIVEVDHTHPPGFAGGIFNYCAFRGLLPERLDGSVAAQVWSVLEQVRDADCVVATTSGIAFAMAWWRVLGVTIPPMVAIHCGLLHRPSIGIKRWLTRRFLATMETVLFGEGELAGFQDLADDVFCRVCQFGVDVEFWRPASMPPPGDEEPYILAVGNDGRRDYETLIAAAADLPCRCVILTRRSLPATLPANVRHIDGQWHSGGVSDQELRTLYRNARCVVVPIVESEQPSGQSVALQGMACGRPVVLTRTRGLWSDTLRNEEQVLLVEPGDINDLRSTVGSVLTDHNLAERLGTSGRRYVVEKGNIADFASCILAACTDAVRRRSGSVRRNSKP